MLLRHWTVVALVVMLTGCGLVDRDPGIGKAVPWKQLDGWQRDDLLGAWQAMQSQCPRMAKRADSWLSICNQVEALETPDSNSIRRFFKQNFVPHVVQGANRKTSGLITGYYEPILRGSLERKGVYQHPVYSRPADMIVVELADLYPQLKGMRLRGRLVGNKLVPYWSRAAIDGGDQPLKGQEILWLDHPHDSFFTQIQGSGRVILEDGRTVGIGYADQNGHPYYAIGKKLVEMNELALEDVSLFSIRRWLEANPRRASAVLEKNPSYVFFELRERVESGPRGSLNVPLTAGRSLAVDRKVIPLGSPVWLATSLPDGSRYQRMMLAQDTGGAISGPVRADVFFGLGKSAELLAGEMKNPGKLWVLLPKESAK